MTQQTLDLDTLNDEYEILGELAARDDARTMIARRKDSGADVQITVVTTPEGDEGNALSHLASDTKRLMQVRHRSVMPLVDARWVGTDAFAMVSERVHLPTLADVLLRRDEGFACPRVALILQEINAALEWARAEKIVHRGVNLDTIYLEPGSDRVLLSFAMRPLPLAEMPGPDSDARTIATLARAMLTRSVADPERDSLPLGEVRPGLPDRLIEQTEQILQLDRNSTVPDMSEYIAIVAMSDNLKRSEMECAETTRKLLDEERVARDKLEAERVAAEQAAAEQARLFHDEREQFAREREKMLAEIARERDNVARERALLEQERSEHERDRALLLQEREEHKRWADDVERAFKAQQEAFAAEQAALREQAARYAETDTHPRPAAALPAVAFPERPEPARYKPEWQRSAARMWGRRPRLHWNKRWNVPAAALGLILLIAVAALAISGNDSPRQTAAAPAVAGTRVVDSVAGGLATAPNPTPASGGVGIPQDFINSVGGQRASGVPADFLAGVAARQAASSNEASAPAARPPVPRRTIPAPSRPAPTAAPTTALPRPTDTARRDTLSAPVVPPVTSPVVFPPVDSLIRRDTALRPRPDTIPNHL
ncbi:MAG TPA: hypothetical protein VEB19_12360 [Gemmatimonadaceae bacterium]|nr:hypothetical protein [Gemmatimonadaceae bacterium]